MEDSRDSATPNCDGWFPLTRLLVRGLDNPLADFYFLFYVLYLFLNRIRDDSQDMRKTIDISAAIMQAHQKRSRVRVV